MHIAYSFLLLTRSCCLCLLSPAAAVCVCVTAAGPHLPKKPRYDPCIDGEVETYFNLPQVCGVGVGGLGGCVFEGGVLLGAVGVWTVSKRFVAADCNCGCRCVIVCEGMRKRGKDMAVQDRTYALMVRWRPLLQPATCGCGVGVGGFLGGSGIGGFRRFTARSPPHPTPTPTPSLPPPPTPHPNTLNTPNTPHSPHATPPPYNPPPSLHTPQTPPSPPHIGPGGAPCQPECEAAVALDRLQ